jgi:hypothetical protein
MAMGVKSIAIFLDFESGKFSDKVTLYIQSTVKGHTPPPLSRGESHKSTLF